MIDQKQYFVIHAARQNGKTTLLLELTDDINHSGDYYAVYCSLETLRIISDPAEGIPRVLDELRDAVEEHEGLSQYDFGDTIDPAQ